MSKKLCVYNKNWNFDSPFKDWVEPVKGDKHKACCSFCNKKIDLSNMGEAALKSHMKGEKRKQACRFSQTVTLKSFFSSPKLPGTPGKERSEDNDMNISILFVYVK